MKAAVKAKCHLCGGEVLMGQRQTSGRYEVSCQDCNTIFYLGSDLNKAVDMILDIDQKAYSNNKSTTGNYSKPPPPPMPTKNKKLASPNKVRWKGSNWNLTDTPVNILKRPCPVCGNTVKMVSVSNHGFSHWALHCPHCTVSFYLGPDYDEAIETYDRKTTTGKTYKTSIIKNKTSTKVTNTTEKTVLLTQKEAYEINKSSSICIVCGAPLGFHPSVSVKVL